jgi:signal transduction histidine kinase
MRAIDNMAENAMRLTRPNGRVVLRVRERAGWVEMTMGSNGPPLAEATRKAVFERYGTGVAATKILVNRGLGLYFCRAVAEAHGGSVRLDTEPELPTCFTLVLPR